MEANNAPAYDVIVIGGGPAGLNAALILARCCRQVLVIDAGESRNAVARQVHEFLSQDGMPTGQRTRYSSKARRVEAPGWPLL
jgi:thioredoxin reductase